MTPLVHTFVVQLCKLLSSVAGLVNLGLQILQIVIMTVEQCIIKANQQH